VCLLLQVILLLQVSSALRPSASAVSTDSIPTQEGASVRLPHIPLERSAAAPVRLDSALQGCAHGMACARNDSAFSGNSTSCQSCQSQSREARQAAGMEAAKRGASQRPKERGPYDASAAPLNRQNGHSTVVSAASVVTKQANVQHALREATSLARAQMPGITEHVCREALAGAPLALQVRHTCRAGRNGVLPHLPCNTVS
jgi:hypothetical protein